MRKKSIPFRKFTKSFPVFPFFSSIFSFILQKSRSVCIAATLLFTNIAPICPTLWYYLFRCVLDHTP